MIDYKLENKTALITGGSHGIGFAIAEALAKQGVHVAICSRSDQRLKDSQKKLCNYGVNVLIIKTDVLNQGSSEYIYQEVNKKWGGVDILINNVGGGGRWGNERVELTEDNVWIEVYQKNALIAAHLTSRLIPFMLNKNWGRVITITSRY